MRKIDTKQLTAVIFIVGITLLQGCSVKGMAINSLATTLSESGNLFASDEDPELVREAVPFSLKLMEGLLAEKPEHRKLLLATSRGFTQYAYAFIDMEADYIEAKDIHKAVEMRHRAKSLYKRAAEYATRGLEISHPGFGRDLNEDPEEAVKVLTVEDVPLIYWLAAARGLILTLSMDDPFELTGIPHVSALIHRALVLDPSYDLGAIFEFLIAFESGRSEVLGGTPDKANEYYKEALRYSGGKLASPYVTYAESISIKSQNRDEFLRLLDEALSIDVSKPTENRLVNIVVQRRARWLKDNVDDLFY